VSQYSYIIVAHTGEPLVFGRSLVLKFSGSPSASATGLHIGHCPHDLGGIVIKGLWAEADIGAAGCQELLAFGSVTVELGGERGFKRNLLPSSGRSRYRGGLTAQQPSGQIQLILCLQGWRGAHSFEKGLQ